VGAAGDLCGAILLGSGCGQLLFWPGLELAVWRSGNTIPDPKLRGRESLRADRPRRARR
jgi:hypothetical protein